MKTDTESKQLQRRRFLRRAIEATAKKGIVTPDGVVAAARDPKSPLHKEFDWNDASAAHQHRLAVARELIRSIEYIGEEVKSQAVTCVGYVHDPREKNKQAYIALSLAEKNKSLAQAIMKDELDRCSSAILRARAIADVLGLRQQLDGLLREITALRRVAAE